MVAIGRTATRDGGQIAVEDEHAKQDGQTWRKGGGKETYVPRKVFFIHRQSTFYQVIPQSLVYPDAYVGT